MKILVTYGSKRGGTAEIGQVIGEVLTDEGHDVDVRPAQDVRGLAGYDAVLAGGALYMWRWYRTARRFVYRHADELRRMPVWLFSSGPLDDSASQKEIPPPWPVRRLQERVSARQHVTFGGRIHPDAPEAKRMPVGDWRDMDRVRAWARSVAGELETLPVADAARATTSTRRHVRTAAVALCLFTGVTALLGGLALFVWPQGPGGMPLSMLEGTPFSSFRIPGLLLLGVVGLGNLFAAVVEQRGRLRSELAVVGAGAALSIWIVVQMLMLESAHWLQVFYLAIGLATLGVGVWLAIRRAPWTSGLDLRNRTRAPS